MHVITASVKPISERLMRELATRCGFGSNLRLRRVGNRREDRVRLGRYLTKMNAAVAVTFGFRLPVSFSRNARPADIEPKPLKPSYPPGSWLPLRIDPHRPESIAAVVASALHANRQEPLDRLRAVATECLRRIVAR